MSTNFTEQKERKTEKKELASWFQVASLVKLRSFPEEAIQNKNKTLTEGPVFIQWFVVLGLSMRAPSVGVFVVVIMDRE